jgi:hypothetical protein
VPDTPSSKNSPTRGSGAPNSPCLAATANHCTVRRELLLQIVFNTYCAAGSPLDVLTAARAEPRCGLASGTLLPEGTQLTPGPVRRVYGYLV